MLWAMMSRFIDGRRKFRTRCWSKRSKRFFYCVLYLLSNNADVYFVELYL